MQTSCISIQVALLFSPGVGEAVATGKQYTDNERANPTQAIPTVG